MNPWSLFWRQGHSTTFGDYFKNGYEGPVAHWWENALESVSPGQVVLEIGCGNGSLLPQLIHSGKGSRYIGVDIANVNLSEAAQSAMQTAEIDVSLHSETPAENIPEPDDSVDLVASVFGVEYSDLDRSLAEAFRLTRSHGKLVALLHHHDSVVTKMSHQAISEFIWQDISSVLDALTAISDEVERLGDKSLLKKSYTAETSRQVVNQMAEKYISNPDQNATNVIMFEFMTSALKFFPLLGQSVATRTEFVDSLRAEYEASEQRFQQMVSVALDDEGVAAIETRLKICGFKPAQIDVIKSNDDILAWALCTEK